MFKIVFGRLVQMKMKKHIFTMIIKNQTQRKADIHS